MYRISFSKSALASSALALSFIGLSACTSYDHMHASGSPYTGPAVKGASVMSAGTSYHTQTGSYGGGYASEPVSTGYSGHSSNTYSTPSYGSSSYGSANSYGTTHSAGHHTGTTHYSGGAPALRGRHHSANHNLGYYGTLGAVNVDGDIFGVQGRLGKNFHKHFGAEIEGSTGITRDNGTGLDYSVAGFGVGRLPITQKIGLLARGGYHVSEYSNGAFDNTEDGFAYGVGGEYALNSKSGLRADWTRYETDNLGTQDAFSLAYLRRF